MIYGYARVSTEAQTIDPQVQALSAAGAAKVFRDIASGAKRDRAGLRKALAALDAGDMLMVTRLDRLARSTLDLLHILNQITAKKAGFRSLADVWADTTTAQGRLLVTIVGGLAEFECDSIRSRTSEGRTRAIARGVKMGPKYKLTPEQRQQALARLDMGEQASSLALTFNVAVSTITRMRDRTALRAGVPQLDADTARAARSFMRRIESTYHPLDAIVYGSRARGTHQPDSDADLAVILKGKPGDRASVSLDMAGIAVDVLDETGILVSPLPLWAVELKRPDLFSNPALIENIRREGLRL